jgi:hypothetical protein
MAHQFDEGRAQAEHALVVSDAALPHANLFTWGPQLGLAAEEIEDHVVAFAAALGARDPESARVIGTAVGSDGSNGELVAAALDELSVLIEDSVLSIPQIAALYTILGQHEAALDLLESPSAKGRCRWA